VEGLLEDIVSHLFAFWGCESSATLLVSLIDFSWSIERLERDYNLFDELAEEFLELLGPWLTASSIIDFEGVLDSRGLNLISWDPLIVLGLKTILDLLVTWL
jgi:hypothetical protein